MDNKNYRNEEVEKFFLTTVHDKEGLPMDDCSFLLNRYYQESCNPEKFNSEFYENQDDRIDDMFPGAPEPVKNLLKLKSYKHQLEKEKRDGVTDEEKSTYNTKRVTELDPVVATTEYAELIPLRWWLP